MLRQMLIALLMFFIFSSPAISCTRALWVSDQGVIVGRTMDWKGDMKSNLWVYPRGMVRDGFADVNSMSWTSQYGSIVTTAYDAMTTDGMNEKGLGAHTFWLVGTDYGQRNPNIPGISVLMWAQYYLDNFATVDEVVHFMETTAFQLEAFEAEQEMSLHLIVDDATGDSAIFEYIDGQLHIYHDRSYTVTTNAPTYDKQLANLRLYKGFGGSKLLPGSTESKDRFVRASFYSKYLPQPSSERDAITKMLSVTYNTAMPYGTVSAEREYASETIWHTALDLTHRVYYFISTANHDLMWANLDKFNLNAGAPVLKLETSRRTDLVGDVTKAFKPMLVASNPKAGMARH